MAKQKRLAGMVPEDIAEIEDAADEYIEAVDAAAVASRRKRAKAESLAEVLRSNRASLLAQEDERGNTVLVYSREGVFVTLTERDKLTVKKLQRIKRDKEEPEKA